MREHQALYRKYFLLKCREGELIVVKQILKWLLKTLYMHGKWNAVNSKFNTYTYLETLASQVVEKQHASVSVHTFYKTITSFTNFDDFCCTVIVSAMILYILE